MSKKAYIGINGVARQIKKGYIGVDGVARKIKKGYIGIGGVARPFWSGGELTYYGTITGLSDPRGLLAATSIGNYALFAGGYSDETNNSTTVDAYNKSLTRSTPTVLYTGRFELAATTVEGYALFGGGIKSTETQKRVDAYNSSLTRSIKNLTTARHELAATTVGSYALFGGGETSNNYGTTNKVEAVNGSLTVSSVTGLNASSTKLAATTIGGYALFAGGRNGSGDAITQVTAYDASLTRSIPTQLTIARAGGATSVGNYAIIAGKNPYSSDEVGAVSEVYDASLTHSVTSALSVDKEMFASGTVGNYALFGGGYGGGPYSGQKSILSTVDAFDDSLTRTTPTALSVARCSLAAATIGNFLLFAGGEDSSGGYASSGKLDTVDVYTIA